MHSLFSFMGSRDKNIYISLIELFREITNISYDDVFTYFLKRVGVRCPWTVLLSYYTAFGVSASGLSASSQMLSIFYCNLCSYIYVYLFKL